MTKRLFKRLQRLSLQLPLQGKMRSNWDHSCVEFVPENLNFFTVLFVRLAVDKDPIFVSLAPNQACYS